MCHVYQLVQLGARVDPVCDLIGSPCDAPALVAAGSVKSSHPAACLCLLPMPAVGLLALCLMVCLADVALANRHNSRHNNKKQNAHKKQNDNIGGYCCSQHTCSNTQ